MNINDSNIKPELTFKHLVFLHMQKLTNFPYIEKDFDALTDYELLCLVVKYLNDVIKNSNEQNRSITNLYNAFLALQTYMNNSVQELENEWNEKTDKLETAFNNLQQWINNYFDNLDVQTEINNKIDDLIDSGEFASLITAYIGRFYNTTLEMLNDEGLGVNNIVTTSGYSSINDGKGASYIIVESTTRNAYKLNNGLFAEVIENDGIKREANSTKNSFTIGSNKLSGVCKAAHNPINQEENSDFCVNVKSNECLVENINIQNPNNYSNKTAINVSTPSQRNKFDSIYIGHGFETGIKIPTSYYSQFNDVWTVGETGILIGDPEQPSNWIGVLDFNSCHFNASKMAFKQVATSTNTICIDKSSFENNVKCIDNAGTLYVRNTYTGDTPVDAIETVGVLDAQAGSRTYFENCTIGYTAVEYQDYRKLSTFDLKGNSTTGAHVYVQGGIVNISNNSINTSQSAIYDSSSSKDEIFIDNVRFVPSTSNMHHNQYPYRLFDNYSPLRSLHPITNYVINGTMKNPVMNTAIISSASSHSDFDNSLVNPFGGKCAIFSRNGSSSSEGHSQFIYKIPKEFIGKEMVLEMYAYCNRGSLRTVAPNLGVGTYYYFNGEGNSTRLRPRMVRATVTPTKETGTIDFFIHWNDTNTDTHYLIAGVILKEKKYEEILSCYKDQDVMYAKSIPTNTSDAKKGDIVYATEESTANCLGWIFNGTSWSVYNSFA